MQVVATSYFDTWANYQVGYDLISQSVANNTSTVKFYGVLNVTGNNISWSWATASVWSTSTGIGSSYGRGSHTVVSQEVTIYHNNDGTYSGTLSGTLSSSYTGGTASGTFTLPKINRIAVVSAVSDFNDETNPTITFTNPAGYNINAFMKVGNTDIATESHIPSTGTYTFSLTDAQRNQLRQLCTGTSLSVRIGIRTENSSGTVIGSTYKDKMMSIVNAYPTFSAAYEDTNATTLAITSDDQQIIRNNSTLQINITNAEAKKYATLSNLECEINGTTYSGTLSGTTGTISVGTLNLSSNTRALVYLRDSRGYETMIPLTLEILDWQTPTGIVSLGRKNNFYTETDINVDANYSSLDSKNVLTLKVRSKKVDEGSYGAYTTLQDNVTTTLQLDNNYQWDVQVLVEDLIGSTTYNLTIDRGIPIVFFDRKRRSMGVNCFPLNDTSLEIDGTLVLNGEDVEAEINNRITKPDILFDDDTGYSGMNVPLSRNWTNYSRIEIIFNNGQVYTMDTDYYAGSTFGISYFWQGNVAGGVFGAFYKLNNNNELEYVSARRFYKYSHDTTAAIDTTNDITVYKVLGYK